MKDEEEEKVSTRKRHKPAPRDSEVEAADWIAITRLMADFEYHTVPEIQTACGKPGVDGPLRRVQAWRDMPGCDVVKAPLEGVRGAWKYRLVGATEEQILGVLSGLIKMPDPRLGPAQSILHREVKRAVVSEEDSLWFLQQKYPELLEGTDSVPGLASTHEPGPDEDPLWAPPW